MSEPTFERVRIQGTELIGTRAFYNSVYRPYRTSAGGKNIVEVYFQETGEIRQFDENVLELLADSD